jgi:hypothetical protein
VSAFTLQARNLAVCVQFRDSDEEGASPLKVGSEEEEDGGDVLLPSYPGVVGRGRLCDRRTQYMGAKL